MKHALTEMTKEELWQLFPIFLVAPNEKWEAYFSEMEAILQDVLQAYSVVRISHIGSTAIKNIWAKNIIDVLVELAPDTELAEITPTMENAGFIQMSCSSTRQSYNLGYTLEGYGEKVYHIHVRYAGDNDELYFRDYLNEHPETAKAYEKLKLSLWKMYEHDRDGYTEAKTAFVEHWTQKAKQEYGKRY